MKATKRRAKSDPDILEHATNNMLRALTKDMQQKDGRVNYEKLRKEGYSDRLLTKLEKACPSSVLCTGLHITNLHALPE